MRGHSHFCKDFIWRMTVHIQLLFLEIYIVSPYEIENRAGTEQKPECWDWNGGLETGTVAFDDLLQGAHCPSPTCSWAAEHHLAHWMGLQYQIFPSAWSLSARHLHWCFLRAFEKSHCHNSWGIFMGEIGLKGSLLDLKFQMVWFNLYEEMMEN